MTWLAPRARTRSTLSVLDTPVTSAPSALAICTANMPTPPDAPMTSTFCPACTRAPSRTACSAATAEIGTVAASSNERFVGLLASCPTGTTAYSAGHRAVVVLPDRLHRLHAHSVLRPAVAFVDEGGIGSLSMRKLGEALGVEAMSLYNHVANKDDLLDGMIDVVFGEIDLPPADGNWKDAMRRRAISVRQALRHHPWAIGLMESRTSPGPAT